MGRKSKLKRFEELGRFSNVIEPAFEEVHASDHYMKGKWNELFFKNNRPIVLELACGKGEYTVSLGRRHRNCNFIGIDIKGARLWRGAKTALEDQLYNVGFIRTRIEFIGSLFAKNEISAIWLTFPDPHPRKSRASKRLTAPRFIKSYREFLRSGGAVHLKTDDYNLHVYTLEIIRRNGLHLIASSDDIYGKPPLHLNEEDLCALQIQTHYEKMHLQMGKKITYIKFTL